MKPTPRTPFRPGPLMFAAALALAGCSPGPDGPGAAPA
ncbi:MAG: hypothetical protein JWO38_6674, partial [Gemmataceae bacterium]|nr:hypothetical protein [Gemmataceae bacterium]